MAVLLCTQGNLDGPVSHEYNEPHALGGANRSNHVGGGGGSGTEEETCVRRSTRMAATATTTSGRGETDREQSSLDSAARVGLSCALGAPPMGDGARDRELRGQSHRRRLSKGTGAVKQIKPSHEFVAKDLHGVKWRFRHYKRFSPSGKMGGWHRLYYQIRPSPWEIEIVGGSISTAQCLALSMTCRHKQCWNLSFITPGPPKLMVLHLL
ncbi:hypothetical protein TRIUR3_10509 [Triticum urartu]|uniref:Uncharacterized protein n=1 Tax=Triticum urartu TaxID=4572 RepID=M7ZA57_TRIUA|nr:hypothetical protein TRIUR3_10509 [Triticum urartu]